MHLEALEMLSKQCDMKLQSLLSSLEGKELTELKETLDQVKGKKYIMFRNYIYDMKWYEILFIFPLCEQ